jgi:hypothetical protein
MCDEYRDGGSGGDPDAKASLSTALCVPVTVVLRSGHWDQGPMSVSVG